MIAVATRSVRRIGGVARGLGRWSQVPFWRRSLFTLTIGLFALAVLFVPLPRYRTTTGWVDAANTSSLFLPSDGIVERVDFDFGEIVRAEDKLVGLRSDSITIEHARLRGELSVARLRSNISRRITLDRSGTAERWKTLQAAEDAVAARFASVQKRKLETEVKAPVGGVILPAPPSADSPRPATVVSLHDRVGTTANAHETWCRISPTGKLHAVLIIDARDRSNVDIGSSVRICLSESPEDVFASTVTSVSAIEQDEPSLTRQAAYQVLCPLPAVGEHDMLQWMGKECCGVFCLRNRTVSSDLTQWIIGWLGGKP
jgi:hypothetical protein